MKTKILRNQKEHFRSTTYLNFWVCGVFVFVIYFLGNLPSSSTGAPGGNPAPCPCDCQVIIGSDVYDTTACGPECAEISTSTSTWTDVIIEPSNDSVSKKKRFEQVVTVETTTRATKHQGKVTYDMARKPPITNLQADCSGCPPCPQKVETLDCGAGKVHCNPQPEDINETRGAKTDKGCIETAT